MMLQRIAAASRAFGVLRRALLDRDRRNELAHRLADYVEYDDLIGAISREHEVQLDEAAPTEATAVIGPLLVTTNAGLFLFAGQRWQCLFPITCFGVGKRGPDLFLGASAGLHSFIVGGSLNFGPKQATLGTLRVLGKFETRYHNERIHQIAYDPLTDSVLCSNTRRTSLLTVNPNEGGIVKEEFLFEDATGFPIHTDQAHLNSVTPHGQAKLFAAHNAGSHGSALGFVLDGRVRAYAYPARGVHDILIHEDSLMFTDSFRADPTDSQPDLSGAIRYQGREYLAEQIDAIPRKLVLRGIAARGRDLAVGYSFFAKRERRLTETAGGILLFKEGVLVAMVDGPFSQVYDILPVDGVRTEQSGPPRTGEELHCLFERDVGPLIYDRAMPPADMVSKLR